MILAKIERGSEQKLDQARKVDQEIRSRNLIQKFEREIRSRNSIKEIDRNIDQEIRDLGRDPDPDRDRDRDRNRDYCAILCILSDIVRYCAILCVLCNIV